MNNFRSQDERRQHWNDWDETFRRWDIRNAMEHPEVMPNGAIVGTRGSFWTFMYNVLVAVGLEAMRRAYS